MILRFNFSMGIVCMTKSEFAWPRATQSYLLSAFFYGYIVTQILGGCLADRFGGKWPLLSGMVVASLGSLVLPSLARLDANFVMVVRVVQGLVSGIAFPSVYHLAAIWSR